MIALDRNIGDFTGWFGYAALPGYRPIFGTGNLDTQRYNLRLRQYPAEGDFGYDGYQQQAGGVDNQPVVSSNSFNPFFNSTIRVNMEHLWTSGGSSGSGLYTSDGEFDHTIVGLLSEGDEVDVGESGIDTYLRLDAEKLDWIAQQRERQDAPTDKAALFNYDTWFDTSHSSVSRTDAVSGTQVTVSARIFNAGTADAEDVRVRFRISSDDHYEGGDEFLGDVIIPNISALGYGTATLNFTMPPRNRGNHHLVWTTDPRKEIAEFDAPLHDTFTNCYVESGDCEMGHRRHGASEAISVSDDLYEPNDSRSSATRLSSGVWLSDLSGKGNQFDQDWYEITVPSGTTQVEADLRFEHDHGDIDLSLRDWSGNEIDAAESVTDDESLNVIVPGGGTYYLLVDYDDAGNEYDLRWTPNRAAQLNGRSISIDGGEKLAGETLDVDFRIEDTGGDADSFVVGIYLSDDATVTTSDRLIRSYRVDSLDADSTTFRSVDVRLPQPGDRFWDEDGT